MTSIILESTLSDREEQLIRQHLPAYSYAVVTDEHTYAALGARVLVALSSLNVQHISLGASPHPSAEQAADLRQRSADAQAIIAIGSGTINDLCKYVAAQEGKPYATFATAPSMNGYLSATASIWEEGAPHSLPCTPPRALFCDLEVLAAAPMRLIRSGLGDSLCRTTAQADWLLSHLLLGTFYDETPFTLLEPFEPALFEHAAALAERNQDAIALLMRTLLASGKGMQIAGGSYPASQGEHLIAHCMNMLYGDTLPPSFHGEQIAVTTLMMAELQHTLFARTTPPTLIWREPPQVWREIYARKIPDASFVATLNARLAEHWDAIRARIRPVMLAPDYLRNVLKAAGAPTTPEEIGWDKAKAEEAAQLAPFVRERFTFLDLA